MFTDYYQVREWLELFIPLVYTKENLGLERIRYLLELLGNPQDKFKSIHVAGTSGKGSTAFYIARLLQCGSVESSAAIKKRSANLEISSIGLISPRSSLRPHQTLKDNSEGDLSGLRHVFDWQQFSLDTRDTLKIGLHLSPHLVDIRERMQIFSSPRHPGGSVATDRISKSDSIASLQNDNVLMPMGRFLRLFNEVKPVVEKIQRTNPELTPSYFEILVAASFLYFAQERVDWAVVEVGLGGRLDATNVLKPEICVITNVGLDHTEILGKTIEKIAAEKAGIIKPGISVVTGVLRLRSGSWTTGRALKVIEKVAKEKKAPVVKVDTQLEVKPLKSDTKDNLFNYYDILRHTSGNFVFSNALLAIETVRHLGLEPDKSAIVAAISSGLPGRFEEIEPGVILDGAHNPDKIRALLEFVRKSKEIVFLRKSKRDRFPSEKQKSKVILVIAFKKGKKWKRMIDLLLKELPVEEVIATKFWSVTDMGRFAAVDPEEIAEYVMSNVKGQLLNVQTFDNSQDAVFYALNSKLYSTNILVLVTGSLYLVGEVRTIWYLSKF